MIDSTPTAVAADQLDLLFLHLLEIALTERILETSDDDAGVVLPEVEHMVVVEGKQVRFPCQIGSTVV
ncbi:hypothetical protein SDC9_179705 [bioreactor metagenome]|uniref:Uncharacterized protein n=1 Tax=bioreactor metagenome TaxID=1076179 RepID=A0A645H2L8_9ZZZZ